MTTSVSVRVSRGVIPSSMASFASGGGASWAAVANSSDTSISSVRVR